MSTSFADHVKAAKTSTLTLHGDTVMLRPFVLADAPRIAHLLQDGRVASMTANIPHPYALSDAQAWLRSHPGQQQQSLGMHWAVTLQGMPEVLGAVSLEIALRDATAHLGYWVGPSYWRQGLGTQAARLITAWARAAGAEKLAARTLVHNEGSKRILTRCGFKVEGRLEKHVVRQGLRHDVLCWGLLHG